jgi:hypothetical protein
VDTRTLQVTSNYGRAQATSFKNAAVANPGLLLLPQRISNNPQSPVITIVSTITKRFDTNSAGACTAISKKEGTPNFVHLQELVNVLS